MMYAIVLMIVTTLIVPSKVRADDLLQELASLRSLIKQSLELEQGGGYGKTFGLHERHKRYWPIIEKAARAQRLDPYLVHAVIKHESNYNARAVSNKGAEGLMQLMPETARSIGVYDSFNPEQNIAGGALYLRQMINKFGGVHAGLLAYNAGPGKLLRGKVPTESYRYAARVLDEFQAARQH